MNCLDRTRNGNKSNKRKYYNSPRIKQKELAEDVGASVSTVQRIIKKLVKEEKIVRMNGKRNGYWKVL